MKTKQMITQHTGILCITFVFFWMFLLFDSCSKSDDLEPLEIIEPKEPTQPLESFEVNFANKPSSIIEGDNGQQIVLKFDKPVVEDISISIKTNGLNEFNLEGAAKTDLDNILVNFNKGMQEAVFVISKPNDNIINEQLELNLQLNNTISSIKIGETNRLHIDIVDDELFGYPKSIILNREATNNREADKITNTYFYTVDGLIRKIETKYFVLKTKNESIWHVTYVYDGQGKIIKTTQGSSDNTVESTLTDYIYENNRIVKSITGNLISTFSYNSNGQIITRIDYYSDWDMESILKYTYFNDGNISIIEESVPSYYWWDLFIPSAIIRTQYNGYIEQSNLFPELQIVPNQVVQFNLPSSATYTYEAEGVIKETKTEEYQYTFDSNQRLKTKTYPGVQTEYVYY